MFLAGASLDFGHIYIFAEGQVLPTDGSLSVLFLGLFWHCSTKVIWKTLSSVGFGWLLLMSFICEEKALSKGKGMLPAFYKRILFINGIFHCGLMPIVQDDCFLASPVNSLSYVSLPLELCVFLPWHTLASLLPCAWPLRGQGDCISLPGHGGWAM